MKPLLTVTVAQLVLGACGAGVPKVVLEKWWRFKPPALRLARSTPGVGRVTLSRLERLDLHKVHPVQLYTVRRHHWAVMLRSEAERQKFRVTLNLPDKCKLAYLKVRVIKPNGQVTRIGKQNIISRNLLATRRHPKRGWKRKVAIVPNLEVGDLVEAQYATVEHYDGREGLIFFGHGGEKIYQKPWPVWSYRYVHTVPEDWDVRYRVYNDATRVHERLQEGRRSFTFLRRNLAPLYREKWRPPLESFAGHFVWRLDAYDILHRRKRKRRWSVDVAYWTKLLFESKRITEGYQEPFEFSGKSTRMQRLRRAFHYARKMRFTGWSSSGIRPLRDVLARRGANNLERAVLLYHLLRAADLKAHYVLVRTADRGPLDTTFPVAGRFNHLVVQIPRQSGIPRPYLVDPSCQRCDLGTLPWWTGGTKALWIDEGDETRILAMAGRDAPPELVRRRVLLRVLEDGTVSGSWRGLIQGASATRLRSKLNRRGARAKKKALAEAVVRRLWKGAQISSHRVSFPSDPKEGVRLQVDFEVPGVAQQVGSDAILPLDFMVNTAFDGIHRSPRRVAPLAVLGARRYEDRFEIVGPPGTLPGELPRRISTTAAMATYRQSVTRGGSRVVIERTLGLRRGKAPRTLYPAVRWLIKKAGRILGQALRFHKRPAAEPGALSRAR